MAKNKRPQRSVHTSGVPDVQIQTGISGVDTFVDPGLAGMPQQKEGTVAPNQPDMQRARDLHAMGAAFRELSPALGNYEISGLKLDAAHRQVGEEQALIKYNLEKAGKVYSDAVSDEILDVLDHPAAAKSMSLATAELMAKDFTDTWVSNEDTFRATSEAALDINATLSLFDKGIEGMARPKLARHPDFEAQLVRSQSKYRSIIESRHRKWLGDKTLEDTISALGAEVGAIVDNGALLEYEPKVTTNEYGLPTAIDPLTNEEIFELNVEGGAARLTEMLDLGQGNLLTSRMMHETMGVALIDIAKNEDDAVASRMAEAMLLRMETGPKNNRVKLVSPGGDGRSQVDKYYRLHKDTIAARQAINTTKGETRAFKSIIQSGVGEQMVDRLVEVRSLSVGGLTDERALAIIMEEEMGGEREKDLGEGVTKSREGNNLVYSKTLSDGSITKETVDVKNKVAQSGSIYWDKAKKNQKKFMYASEVGPNGQKLPSQAERLASKGWYGVDEIDAVIEIKTALETNMVPHALSADLESAMQGVSVLRNRLETEEYDDIKDAPSFQAFKKGLAAAIALEEAGSDYLFTKTITTRHGQAFWTTARMLMTDDTVARYGGGTVESVFHRMIGQSSTRPISLANFQTQWDNYGVTKMATLMSSSWFGFVGGDRFHNPRKASQEIEDVATTLFAIGAIPTVPDAIDRAFEEYKKTTINLGGKLVRMSDIDEGLLKNGVPADFNYKVAVDSEMWFALEAFGIDEFAKGAVVGATHFLDIIDNAWYEGVQGEDRNAEWVNLSLSVYEQHSKLGKRIIKNATLPDVLEGAAKRWKSAPPRNWAIQNPSDISGIGFTHKDGSGGRSWFVEIQFNDGTTTPTLNPETRRPYTLRELSQLAKEGEAGVSYGFPEDALLDDYVNISKFQSLMPSKSNIIRHKRSHYMSKEEFLSYTGPGSGSPAWEEIRVDIMREEDEDIMGPTYD